ncbi:MAG TPA: beta-ketoacyl synthase N-terminal-like domain-containing protein, partial [Acidimicrobiales bacterium]
MKRELDRRVVITGTGTINPVGTGTEATWQALVSGQSGIGPITLFDPSAHPVRIAGEVKGFDANAVFGKRRARHLDRFTQLALVAAREAIEASKLNLESIDRTRVGVNFASGVGGIGTTEQGTRVMLDRGPEWLSPYMCPMMLPNMAAGEVAMEFGLQGPSSCTVTACAASAMAIGDGYDQIRLGRADAMVCGGSEAGLTPLGLAGFSAMKALSVR